MHVLVSGLSIDSENGSVGFSFFFLESVGRFRSVSRGFYTYLMYIDRRCRSRGQGKQNDQHKPSRFPVSVDCLATDPKMVDFCRQKPTEN